MEYLAKHYINSKCRDLNATEKELYSNNNFNLCKNGEKTYKHGVLLLSLCKKLYFIVPEMAFVIYFSLISLTAGSRNCREDSKFLGITASFQIPKEGSQSSCYHRGSSLLMYKCISGSRVYRWSF